MALDPAVYAAVAARRMQWDNFLWQVPTLSLTAQAFLFTISLGPDSSTIARTFSCVLSIVISVMSALLMARHRHNELGDARWLEHYENQLDEPLRVHGEHFVRIRESRRVTRAELFYVPSLKGYRAWIVGVLIFGVAAAIILVLAYAAPGVFRTGA